MPLEEEIRSARREIFTDGYDMSIGELMNLYADQELVINPSFQRYFVWTISQKTRFIESIILGIPVPPIFVYQNEDSVWELVDGLQRLSTILEFAGQLRDADGNVSPPLTLNGTKTLPALADKTWAPSDEDGSEPLSRTQQLEVKRARIRVEILKKESDPQAKFELFQRLNTGGTQLKPQEIRNVVMLMIDRGFHDWIHDLANLEDFITTLSLAEQASQRQQAVELAIRFFVYRNIPYQPGLDVHEYIDDAMIKLAQSEDFDRQGEADVFRRTFKALHDAMGAEAFIRWNGERFLGKFLISAYEVVAYGLSRNIDEIENLPVEERASFIRDRIIAVWLDDNFQRYSGAGVRGTTRLRNLMPVAEQYFTIE